jgi:hypothetical protein
MEAKHRRFASEVESDEPVSGVHAIARTLYDLSAECDDTVEALLVEYVIIPAPPRVPAIDVTRVESLDADEAFAAAWEEWDDVG